MENPIKFFTATILDWKPLLLNDAYKTIVIDSLQFLVQQKRIWIYGFVIMPNHIHLLWRLQEPYIESNVQRDFLKFVSQQIKFDLIKNQQHLLASFKSNAKDRDYQFWERRPYASEMYNRKVVEQKLDYIHNNPVSKKWNLASSPENYYFSSAAYYLNDDRTFDFITRYEDHI